jgi:hypothetical protein
MKPQELRIGNLIDYECTTHVVIEIGKTLVESYWINWKDKKDEYICHYDEISPIPLTEEWLTKFGFKRYYDVNPVMGNQIIWRFGKLAIENRLGELRVLWYDADDDYGTSICLVVKFVHQLQNLYFALTDTELTYKP